jgi:hypothetical protein
MYVSPKRTKYVTMSPQILRNQLQIPKDSQGNEVEVKSEPIAILANQVRRKRVGKRTLSTSAMIAPNVTKLFTSVITPLAADFSMTD